jgi:putative membrane protein
VLGVQIGAPFAATLLAGAMYVAGGRAAPRPVGGPGGAARRLRRQRAVMFGLALVALLAALASPIDTDADRLFWVHMGQHLLLTMVAAPLLALSAPWMQLWRALPLGARRAVARPAVSARPVAPARTLLRPLPAFVAFNLTMWAWHLPALYDLTLRSQWVHYTEHLMFLVTGVLLWVQLVDSPPLHASLANVWRLAVALGTLVNGWFLALILAFWPSPLYPAYAALAHRPGGISAITDQQYAAGMMWMVGSLPLSILVLVLLGRVAGDDQRGLARGSRATVHAYSKGV